MDGSRGPGRYGWLAVSYFVVAEVKNYRLRFKPSCFSCKYVVACCDWASRKKKKKEKKKKVKHVPRINDEKSPPR